MLNSLRIKWNQFLEAAKEKSPREAAQKALSAWVQLDRVVVPVYNDLSALKQIASTADTASLEFLIVDRDNAGSVSHMNKTASRRLKDTYNTRSGYYAYAAVSDGEIIGDIWCATHANVKRDPIHGDLSWLDINCGANEAYMFDMYVVPGSRGKVVTSFLLGNALHHLKKSGIERVYGFYEKNNLPALWIHRLFGYTELGKRKISRVLLYRKSEAAPSGN
jgi:GNAT superfamily N-acetyltransferase